MTYVNKGQFYTCSLDYIPDPCKPLKSQTVKVGSVCVCKGDYYRSRLRQLKLVLQSVLMVVFREDKSYEEEIKTWQFWHARQHSVKQRILEVDAKNSSGVIGQIEEVRPTDHRSFASNKKTPRGEAPRGNASLIIVTIRATIT